jgi:Flp pilus assembly protein TadD
LNPAIASPSASPAEERAVDRIQEALAAGRLEEATRLCEQLLAASPSSTAALSLRGEIQFRRGEPGEAKKSLERALSGDKANARAHWVLGNIQHDQGQLDRAIASYRRALRASPRFVEAHNDLGTAYHAKGWLAEAEQCYRSVLELDPDNMTAVENLATTLRAAGRYGEARDLFARTLKLRIIRAWRKLVGRGNASGRPGRSPAARAPDPLLEARVLVEAARYERAEPLLRARLKDAPEDPDAHQLLAVALSKTGKRTAAIEHFERAIALRPATPELHVALGNTLSGERRYAEALQSFQTALALDPAHAPATANIARVLHDLGHFREAEETHRLSLEQDPDLAVSHSNYAGTLISLGNYAEAENAARRSIAINPRLSAGHVALASALMELGRLEEARAALDQARQLEPEHPHVLATLAKLVMTFDGDFAASEQLLERAKTQAPEDANIRVRLARVLLSQYRFAQGWEEYEWRKRQAGRSIVYTKFPYPEWDGEALEGKAAVVNNEQGLGDEIMFASCIADIAPRLRRCAIFCSRRLEPLFKRSFASAEVYAGSHLGSDDPFPNLEGIDYQIAAASLPRVYRRCAAGFPCHDGYLRADPGKIARWQERVAALGPGLKVGLSWKGGTPLTDQVRRTLTLERLEPVLQLSGLKWVSLQYGDCKAELEHYGRRSRIQISHWQEAVDDLDETAALMCALDLRISVCNTQVHLSGGLGREVWVLAPLTPDWRYGVSGERMLWYPAARMFRQPNASDWETPIAALAEALAARVRA